MVELAGPREEVGFTLVILEVINPHNGHKDILWLFTYLINGHTVNTGVNIREHFLQGILIIRIEGSDLFPLVKDLIPTCLKEGSQNTPVIKVIRKPGET